MTRIVPEDADFFEQIASITPDKRNSPEGMRRILNLSYLDTTKRQHREALLRDHPELRVRVNSDNLRAIINYRDFHCHPLSSVAADLSIKGSDIDGGVVVTDQPSTADQQLAFIQELRRQGFEVYHSTEIQNQPAGRTTVAEGAVIKFFTPQELESYQKEKGLDATVMISKVGYEIK